MAKWQGKIRMKAGITRPLTRHEFSRGYIYISKDKTLSDILDVENFTAEVIGVPFHNRRIDVSGRLHIPPKNLLSTVHGTVKIQVVSRSLVVISHIDK